MGVATATDFMAAGVEDGDEDEEKMPAPGVGRNRVWPTSKIWCG